mgnify:CR=1 FL=1
MSKKFCLILIILLSMVTGVYSKSRIAIIDFVAKNMSQMDASSVTDFFRENIVNSNKFTVLDRANMDKIMAEQNFQFVLNVMHWLSGILN